MWLGAACAAAAFAAASFAATSGSLNCPLRSKFTRFCWSCADASSTVGNQPQRCSAFMKSATAARLLLWPLNVTLPRSSSIEVSQT